MSTPVSKVVNVTILTSPTFPARAGFGLLNIAGSSARLPLGERIRFYNDQDEVADDFSTTDQEYIASGVFFAQSPHPTIMAISRRFPAGGSGELIGVSTLQTSITAWNAIVDGQFDITINGTLLQLDNLNFATAVSLSDVASIIQVGLVALLPGTVFLFDNIRNRFIARSPTVGIASTVSFVAPETSVGAGVDISTLMGMNAASGAKLVTGIAAETVTQSMDALQDIDQSWYGFTVTNEVTTPADVLALAAWAEARIKIFGFSSNQATLLDPSSTGDLGYTLKNLLRSRTFLVYDPTLSYMAVSAIARAFTVNFSEQNSTITLKFKVLPGTPTTPLLESQRRALVDKNVNYYTLFGDSAMLAEGIMSSGQFFDERHGLDWLQNAIETNVFGFLYTRTTKVPQTDKGVAALVQQVEKAMQEGVNNALLAPGVWNGMNLGEVTSGDFLPRGFYVFAQAVADQNQSDREARKAPPIQVLAKGAGAIHFADITVTFER